jgi:hypothetical protein
MWAHSRWLWFDGVQARYEDVILGRRPWANVITLAWSIFWLLVVGRWDSIRELVVSRLEALAL